MKTILVLFCSTGIHTLRCTGLDCVIVESSDGRVSSYPYYNQVVMRYAYSSVSSQSNGYLKCSTGIEANVSVTFL